MGVTLSTAAVECRKCGLIAPTRQGGADVCPKCFRAVAVDPAASPKSAPPSPDLIATAPTPAASADRPADAPYVSSELDLIILPADATGLPDCFLIEDKPKKPVPFWRLTPRVYVRFRAAVEARLKSTDPKRAVSPGEAAVLLAKLDAAEAVLRETWPGAPAAVVELLPVAGKIEIAKPPKMPKFDADAEDFWEQS